MKPLASSGKHARGTKHGKKRKALSKARKNKKTLTRWQVGENVKPEQGELDSDLFNLVLHYFES